MTELKILLCDDDIALQSLRARRLEKMGIKPDTTDNGRRAIERIKDNNYDLIITDIYLPEAPGLEVLQFAKQLDPDTQVVIMTSSGTIATIATDDIASSLPMRLRPLRRGVNSLPSDFC